MAERTLSVRIIGDTSLLAREFEKAVRASGKFEDRMARTGAKMQRAGRAMTIGVTLPLVGIAAAAVNAEKMFSQSMNQVAAATGAPASEMESLRDLAKKLGADTIYSANESAEAMLELAKSGFSPAQIQAGALASSLQLAAAGDLALADAAQTAANAMNTFGLEAGDLNEVANALAGGANESTASVEELRQALQQGGLGAKMAGLSLQQTVGVLAGFADMGLRGSDAGTSLKTMLMRLTPQTDAAAKAMESLGLEFVNADGSFRDIDEIAQELKDTFGDMSEAERSAALTRIFGSDATRAATALMDLGAEGVKRYTDATNDQTAAQTMAEARMSGTAGALEQMSGSLETAALAAGEALAPTVVDLAGEVKELADWFGGLDRATQETYLKWAAGAAAAGPILSALGGVAKGAGAVVTGLKHVPGAARFAMNALDGVEMKSRGAAAGAIALRASVALLGAEMVTQTPEWARYRASMDSLPITTTKGQVAALKDELGFAKVGVAALADENFRNNLSLTQQAEELGWLGLGYGHLMTALDGTAAAMARDAVETGNLAAATDAAVAARDRLAGAEIGLEQAELNVETANARVAETERRLEGLRAAGKTKTQEYKDATLDHKQAVLDAKRATQELKTAMEERNKVKVEVDKQNKQLKKLEDQARETEAALKALSDPNWQINIIVSESRKSAADQFSQEAADALPDDDDGAAAGRTVTSPQLTWVGEGGYREDIISWDPRYRAGNLARLSEAASGLGAMPAVAGGSSLTVNVDARGSSDPAAVEAAARRGALAGMTEAVLKARRLRPMAVAG